MTTKNSPKLKPYKVSFDVVTKTKHGQILKRQKGMKVVRAENAEQAKNVVKHAVRYNGSLTRRSAVNIKVKPY